MPFAATWIVLEILILSDVGQRKIYDIAYMWTVRKGYKWTYLQNEILIELQMQKINLQLLGGLGGREKLGDWDWHIHMTVYKIYN